MSKICISIFRKTNILKIICWYKIGDKYEDWDKEVARGDTCIHDEKWGDSAHMILIDMKSNNRLSPGEVTKGAAPDSGGSTSTTSPPRPVTL